MRSEAFTAAQLTGRADAVPTLSAAGNSRPKSAGHASGTGNLGFAAVMSATKTISDNQAPQTSARMSSHAAPATVPSLTSAQAAMILNQSPLVGADAAKTLPPPATATQALSAQAPNVQALNVQADNQPLARPFTKDAATPAPDMARQQPPVHKNRFSVNRTAGAMPVWQPKPDMATQATALAPGGVAEPEAKLDTGAPKAMGFGDLIDMVNPLQHIPLVSTLYRHVTGDTISPAARMMGGTLYGGPVGALASMASVAVEDRTGKDIGDNIYDAAFGDSAAKTQTQMAQATQDLQQARFNRMMTDLSRQSG